MVQRERAVLSALAVPAAPSAAVQAERDDAAAQKRARAVGIRGTKSPWQPYMSSSPLPHDVDVDSPLLTHLLATWTKNRAEAEALRAWIRLACDPGYTETRPPELAHGAAAPGVEAHMPHCVHLERIGAEVKEGVLTFVYPLLRRRQLQSGDIAVDVATRDWVEERTDLRIEIVGRTQSQ